MQDRVLSEACRHGDLQACRQLVEQYGERGVRAAFLLTGEPSSAETLAVEGVQAALERAMAGEDEDFPSLVALEVARRFLPERARWRDSRSVLVPGMDRQRFAVDTERARVRSALALLDPLTRALVVLRLYCRLPDGEVADVLRRDAAARLAIYTAAVERLCAILDLDGERELAVALAMAAVDAPRTDIWGSVAPDLEQRLERDARQRRLINTVSALVAATGLLAGILIVSGAFTNEGGEGEAPSLRDGRASSSMLQAFPILQPTPTPTPQAEVADLLLVSSADQGGAGVRFFDPDRDEARQIAPEGAVDADRPVVAPDGSQAVMLWYEFAGGEAQGYVALLGPQLRQPVWKTLVESAPHDSGPAARPPFMMAAALNHERVFVARHPWQSWDPVAIDVLDRASGQLLETIATPLAGTVAHDVRLYAPPGHDAVYLFAITREGPVGDGQLQITFLAFEVPGGEQIASRILRDVPDSRSFFLYGSKLSRDGSFLFGVDYTDTRQEIAVHFFDLRRGTVEPRVPIPFQPVAGPLPVQQAVSHDGRWLYVLSPASLEIAVVDLDERRLQGIVPVDSGVLNGAVVDVVYTVDRDMQLSRDGRRLYAIGTSMGRDSARPAGVWVIDTTTWTVVQHLAPETRPAAILLDGDDRSLFIRESNSSLAGSQDRLYVLDLASGRVAEIPAPLEGRFSLTSLAALYRDVFAISPWVEGRPPMPVPESRPLAGARVEVDPRRVEAGEPITVEVRFVHPLDGSPVEETAADDARFRPPAFVRATWRREGGSESVVVELGPAEHGLYRGVAILPEAGRWTLRIDLDWPVGQVIDRTIYAQGTVRVDEPHAPSIQGGIGQLAIR